MKLSRTQRGLTLAEIAMALFAVGISALSIATVYLQREQATSVIEQRAIAQGLIKEITDRITAQHPADVRFENAIGVRCAKSANNLSPQALATNDVACWQERVATALPNGAGSIVLDTSAVPATYAVTVSWSRPHGGLASFTTRAIANAMSDVNAPGRAQPAATRAAN